MKHSIKYLYDAQKVIGTKMNMLEQHTGLNKKVYFIFQEGDDTVCKIGKSKQSEDRVVQLQTGNPNKLYIYNSLPGYTYLESCLHRENADRRIGTSEWFRLNKDEVDKIVEKTMPFAKNLRNFVEFP